MTAAKRLRELYAKDLVVAPGSFDGLSAKLIQQAGFQAVYSSGGAISRSSGIPDLGLMDLSENVRRVEQIVDAVDVPVIADADTGHGNALNARRTARLFERAGVAGFHLEDQKHPKKCGHYEDKGLVSADEMIGKIKAVRDALHDDDFVIIARTDAIAVEGFNAAIDRASAYAEAGADVLFVEAPTTEEQIVEVARLLPQPKLLNMFHSGKTPVLPIPRLRELGYSLCIIPSDLQRAAIRAMQQTLEVLRRDGSSVSISNDLASFKDREAILGTDNYAALAARYGS